MLGKGFVKMLEIVLFSYIFLILLIPNLINYSMPAKSEFISANIACNDLLSSYDRGRILDKILTVSPFSGYDDLTEEYKAHIDFLDNISRKIFPGYINYEYEIFNIPKFKIIVGCIGDNMNCSWLKNKILTPSYPTSVFELRRVTFENMLRDIDVFVIFRDTNLSEYRYEIETMLKKGKGFVLVRNFSSQPDNFSKELFGLNYTGIGSSEPIINFVNISSSIKSNRIAKRFVNNLIRIYTPTEKGMLYLKDKNYSVIQNLSNNCVDIANCSDCLHENESCVISGIANITLFQIDPSSFSWIDIKIHEDSSNPRNYFFVDNLNCEIITSNDTLLYSGSFSAANIKILGDYAAKPRTFWIYNYNRTKDDLNLLLKTGIIWASGEHFFVFNKSLPVKKKSCLHIFADFNNNKIPYIVKLYYWG